MRLDPNSFGAPLTSLTILKKFDYHGVLSQKGRHMDFGKGTGFWRQFFFLRSAIGDDGRHIITHPEAFDEFSVEIATYEVLSDHAGRSGPRGRGLCRSSQESVHILDGDGRVLATLKEGVGAEVRDVLSRIKPCSKSDTVAKALLRLQRHEVASVRYFVFVCQDYSSSLEGHDCASSIKVSIVPSKEALVDWIRLYKNVRKYRPKVKA
jgi:hypothetical protein